MDKNSFNDTTKVAMINTVHLKARSKKPFQRKNTFEDLVKKGQKVKVRMMHLTGYFMGASVGDDLKLLRLPYKGSKDFFLYLGLPKSRKRFAEVAKTWREVDFDDLDLISEEYKVTLPKFKVESTLTGLKDAFKDAGIQEMFDRNKADLSGMTSNPYGLFISSIVLHRGRRGGHGGRSRDLRRRPPYCRQEVKGLPEDLRGQSAVLLRRGYEGDGPLQWIRDGPDEELRARTL